MADPVARYLRWRRIVTVVGCVLLGLELILIFINTMAEISEITTGSWSGLGAAVVTMLFQLPLAILGIVIGIVLLIERGGGRFSVGIPLLALSIALLKWDTSQTLAELLAGLLGYRR
ncbi:MAG TPA: hypothetical protein VFT43_07050 [Candidatus Polarisedimenticolia bacterium]|nr:hypothetical protein [Candidatus Polarisedimenticolia bacterium]